MKKHTRQQNMESDCMVCVRATVPQRAKMLAAIISFQIFQAIRKTTVLGQEEYPSFVEEEDIDDKIH